MTKSTAAVLADALRLDTPERAELAAELLGSLSGPPDPRADAAWDVEIDRRLAAITTGTAELESWESVKRRIETEILGR
jgi:putative addiction module component (TIGR02574 family)